MVVKDGDDEEDVVPPNVGTWHVSTSSIVTMDGSRNSIVESDTVGPLRNNHHLKRHELTHMEDGGWMNVS